MTPRARVLSVVGARPQFIKLAPISRAFRKSPSLEGIELQHEVIHTGQHYDERMSEIFFEQLELPRPRHDLEVGSGTHGVQTGLMLQRLEQCFLAERPDAVLVYGDTNSTLAASMAAAKLHIPLAHVEAGLRSFDRTMPEEINRIVADRLSDVLFAPTDAGMRNLEREGLGANAVLCGDVMYDAVLYNREVANRESSMLRTLGLTGAEYGVLTIHRASNTTREVLMPLLRGLTRIARDTVPLVFPMHPRTRATLGGDLPDTGPALRIIEPVGYLDMLNLVDHARIVLTDSGGLQKEAVFLEKPCVTLREETEWVETVTMGANRLVGCDPRRTSEAVRDFLSGRGLTRDAWRAAVARHYGEGRAAERIHRRLASWMKGIQACSRRAAGKR
jgi:UDP-N-acetylglucosamine 2-epimerase